jgi:hypothetical protein
MGDTQSTSPERVKASPESVGGKEQKEIIEKAEKMDNHPNKKPMEAIRDLEGGMEVEEQLDGVTAMSSAIITVMRKLIRNDVKPKDLDNYEKLIDKFIKNDHKCHFTGVEELAMKKLPTIMSQRGETQKYFHESWPEFVEKAEKSKSAWKGFIRSLENNPGGALAVGVFAVAGVWLTWNVVEAAGKQISDKSSKDKKWYKNKILWGCGIFALAGVLGWKQLSELAKYYGIDTKTFMGGILAKKAQEKAEDVKEKAEDAVDDAKEKAEDAAKKAKDRLKKKDEDQEKTDESDESAETPDQEYKEARDTFITLKFKRNPDVTETQEKRFRLLCDSAKDVEFSKIENAVKTHNRDKGIPGSKFPEIKFRVPDKDLYLFMESFVEYASNANPIDTDQLDDLLIKIYQDKKGGNS